MQSISLSSNQTRNGLDELINVLENLAIATNLDLIPTQFSRNRSATMLNQVSQCISPYDFTTGLPLTSVNLSVAMVSDDLILDDAQDAASVQLPLNEKIFDEPPTFTVTSLRRTFMEDLLNLSRGAILSDALRVDVSKNIGALGLVRCDDSNLVRLHPALDHPRD